MSKFIHYTIEGRFRVMNVNHITRLYSRKETGDEYPHRIYAEITGSREKFTIFYSKTKEVCEKLEDAIVKFLAQPSLSLLTINEKWGDVGSVLNEEEPEPQSRKLEIV